ncbi:MAG: NAD(P)-dependent oxidoreductase [Bacteroidaceae bacterium]|jgi:nucleoside-diphosphate-sugar epimerase|nr:NAD(P)-dependent oxidoreductase [Bacteroidaceae bacterium]
MKAFVTGASGFVGSYLVKVLIDEGHEVLCLKRPSSNLSKLDDYVSKVRWVDNTDNWKESLVAFQPDIIYHLAWDGVTAKERSVWQKQIGNIIFQQELLDATLAAGSKKYVGIGSQAEYGNFKNKIDESYPVCPMSAYAAAKVAALDIVRAFCEINQIEWYWFRLFPLFGPHESDQWLIPSLIKNIFTQESMDFTPGEQKLPYLYVGECAKAIKAAITADGHSGVYNICSDNPLALKELVARIRDKVRPDFKLNFGAFPYRYGQSMYMEGDTTALRRNIYNIVTSDFEQRLSETIDYYIRKYSNNPSE